MVPNYLSQFLQSLCCNSPWDYAVFWRLQQHQSQTLLTWEDGYFNILRPREPPGDMMDSFSFNLANEGLSSCPSDNQNGNLADSPIGAMVAEMSSIYYLMGKGVVGEVAYSESTSWIFADSIMAGGCGFNLISGCPDELLHQFVAGIKTVLLVPLVPFGVLQLGSMDKVAEDAKLVACVKNKFDTYRQLVGGFTAFRSESEFLFQPSEVKGTYMENMGDFDGIVMNKMNENIKVLDSIDIGYQKMSNANQMSVDQDLSEICQGGMSKVTDIGSESKINIHSVGTSYIAEPFMYPVFENCESEMTWNILRSSHTDEELDAFSFFRDHETTHSSMAIHRIMESYSNQGIIQWPFEKEDWDDTISRNENLPLRFPSDCELHKALGSVLCDPDLNLLQPAGSGKNSGSSAVRQQDIVHCIQPSACNSGAGSARDTKVECLLEALIDNANSVSDDSSSNKSHSSTSPKASSGRFASPQQGAVEGDDQAPWSCMTSALTDDSKMKMSTSASFLNGMISALIEHQSQGDGNSNIHPAKGSKPTGANKRRARLGENQKPRPRDRQLIQDRIKELRELVPSGSKCSIDGLLDRTIKHMQFLRKVTDQADKIKQHLLKEDSDENDFKGHTIKYSNQNGTSWALELGSEQQTFPIVVKDLEYPGHMLIQMLCDDHGRFLEIADVIHRLELTILKGVMEKRSDDSTWAHFIIEASGNFHRLDIFWPLMQLLQQNPTQISSRI